MEEQCEFVSERGYQYFIQHKILCEKDVDKIIIKIKDKDLIFCKSDFIPLLAKSLDSIKFSFYLISGRSDYTIPDTFKSECSILLNSQKVLKWFTVNCVSYHEKIIPIPLGIDYHTMYDNFNLSPKEQENALFDVKKTLKDYNYTKPHAIANFHHAMNDPPIRKMFRTLAFKILSSSDCVTWLQKQDRLDFWRSCNDNMFVICPFGNGPDTHRPYEILALGRVPIIYDCYMNKELFSNLPVVIVESWKCITKEFLVKQHKIIIEKMQNNEYDFNKITCRYWINKINNIINS